MVLKNDVAMRIADFDVSRLVNDVKRVNRGATLCADARQSDCHTCAIEAGEKIIQQSEAVRRLDLNKRVSRMRFVVDRDAGGELDLWAESLACFFSSLFDQRPELEPFVLECAAQSFFHRVELVLVRDCAAICVADAEDIEGNVVAARKDVGA